MSATLQMIFRNTANRNTTVSVADPDTEITALDVEAVMDSIISRNVFNTSGGDLESKVKAQVVSRTVDVLSEY
jgi:hypothetical protein